MNCRMRTSDANRDGENDQSNQHAEVSTSVASGVEQLIFGHLAPSDHAPDVGETFTRLVDTPGVTIEAIHSSDSPDLVEYHQSYDEWILVMDGRASLDVDGRIIDMSPGDWMLIPAHVPHSVLSTERGTRWITVNIGMEDDV